MFLPGETLNVTCGEKFWISTPQDINAVTTCNNDGQWSIRPVCKGTESQHWDCCGVFMVPEPMMADLDLKLKSFFVPEVVCRNHREFNVRIWSTWRWWSLGDTVRYSCITDYKSPDGSNLAKCTRDGWKPKPLCQGIVNVQLSSVSFWSPEVISAMHFSLQKESCGSKIIRNSPFIDLFNRNHLWQTGYQQRCQPGPLHTDIQEQWKGRLWLRGRLRWRSDSSLYGSRLERTIQVFR